MDFPDTSPQWQQEAGDPVHAYHQDRWIPATIVAIPNDDTDPQRRIQAWKLQTESGDFIYIWDINHLAPLPVDDFEEDF